MTAKKFDITIAKKYMCADLISFCDMWLRSDNDALYSKEFLCEQGLRAAVDKGFVVVALKSGRICGMVRFYPNKRSEMISVYQFAVSEDCRGNGCVDEMMNFIHNHYNGAIVSKCPSELSFNNYYTNKGWKKIKKGKLLFWEWRNKL